MDRTSKARAASAALVAMLMLLAAACSGDDSTDDRSSGSVDGKGSVVDDAASSEQEVVPVAMEWTKVLAPASCRCSDGTPFHYWTRAGDPEKVVFYLEGGGACFSAQTCASETATYTVNLDGDDGPGGDGIFDLDNAENPLADHSMVYVPYCTGDLHLGSNQNQYDEEVLVHHNGYTNAATALAGAAALFPDAKEVVVAGSSAGSAGAPAFGGGAHDVWPDASIAVVADASAAYPGTPEITLAIGALWGVLDAVPLWPATADLPDEAWSLPGLFANSTMHFPEIRFASYNDAFDEVQAAFTSMIGLDSSNLVELIDATNESIREQGVDLVSWVSPGTEHTILGKAELYDEEVGGTRLIDWLTDFIAGNQVDDVHCGDCEPPT